MIIIRFARRTLHELDRLEAWCKDHQPARWPLFTAELDQVIQLLRESPELGHSYVGARAQGVRRILLEKAQYYVYYRYLRAKARIDVLSIWSTRRSRPPSL